ncbi:MAG: CpsD/CapB family tyrosine-protein kinase, partial [Oscillospiraceae bacterium]|nr:CpsD/CapB family tyrosine-protein kinase [Oscillospiraceae bacterium]
MPNKKSNSLFNKPYFISEKAPFEYVESYKSLRTNINFLSSNGKNRKIIVTSAMQDEGKTSVSINLAISLAQENKRVLLIDADLRNPSVGRYLRMKKDVKLGLSNILNGEVKVGDCLNSTEYGFDVIVGGPIPPNPTEMLSSTSMQDLLQIAGKHYDYVICDAPPVAVVTDAVALSPLCDGILLVVRQKFANRNHVRSVVKILKSVNAKILGVILNQYNINKRVNKRYYKYSQYKYGYGYG